MSSLISCFELLRLACGRCVRTSAGGYSVVGVDFPLREPGNRTPDSDTAERNSASSCPSVSSSSVIVGRCSEPSSECSELLSPWARFDRVPPLSDLADDG